MLHGIEEIQKSLLKGGLSTQRIVNDFLLRIQETRHLNIYAEVWEEEAIEKARSIDHRIQNDPESLGRLFGIVISIKDVISYKEHRVSAASKILNGYISKYNSTVLEHLLREDAIIIGSTNCDEFAMGSTTENSSYGPCLNGLNEEYVPGGSSGGAAVSVQMKTCHLALGTDTGGSVRQPASFCGISGFKPSYGAVSRYGLIAYGSSFDQIGILGEEVADINKLFEVIGMKDQKDGSSVDIGNFESIQEFKRVGYISEMINHEGLSEDVRHAFSSALDKYKEEGFELVPLSFDLIDYLVPCYYVLTTAEASSNLARYDGLRYGLQAHNQQSLEEMIVSVRTKGFGSEVKRRIMMGTFVLSVGYYDSYFLKAQQLRRLICEKIENLFGSCDVLAMPTTTGHAWKLGEGIKDPVQMYLADIYTVLANLAGLPAISIPLGQNKPSGMPFGIQFASKRFSDRNLLRFVQKISA